MRKSVVLLMFVVWIIMACGTLPSGNPGGIIASETQLPAETLLPTRTESPTEVDLSIQSVMATVTPEPIETVIPTLDLSVSGGGLIVFYSERDGNAEIYTMNADGSSQQRLTFNDFEDVAPDWSPDGSQIAFISDREDPNVGECFPDCLYQLFVVNADGTDERKLIDTPSTVHHPDWHPDGTRLLFDSEIGLDGDIYVVDLISGEVDLFIEDGFWGDWSPDGKQIAFSSNRDGNIEIYSAEADGSNPHRLTDDPRLDLFPSWSPDGKRIAFMAGQGGTRQVYLMDADGSSQRQLTTQGAVSEDPAWSPDGEWLAFQSNRDGNYEIFILNVNVESQSEGEVGIQRLTTSLGGDYWASWRPPTASEVSAVSFAKSDQVFPSVPTWKIGLADLDNDGDLDVVFANGQRNFSQVWINNGNGVFTDSGQELGRYGHGVDVGDVDGDGDVDIVISTHSEAPTRVYLNEGNAVFQEVIGAFEANIGFSVELYDLDGDGDLDAVGEDTNSVNVYWNDGAGRFSESGLRFPLTSVWGDVDTDGDVDVLLKEEDAGYSVLLNDGQGNFDMYWEYGEQTAMEIGGMALGDMDSDGDLDVVITNGHHRSNSHPVQVFRNNGSGRFEDSGQRLSSVRNAGVSLGDLDGDGDLDLVLSDFKEPCQIWLNDGSGLFTDSRFRFGDDNFYRHIHLADLDGDGDLDIFLATFGDAEGPNEIWFNQKQ